MFIQLRVKILVYLIFNVFLLGHVVLHEGAEQRVEKSLLLTITGARGSHDRLLLRCMRMMDWMRWSLWLWMWWLLMVWLRLLTQQVKQSLNTSLIISWLMRNLCLIVCFGEFFKVLQKFLLIIVLSCFDPIVLP